MLKHIKANLSFAFAISSVLFAFVPEALFAELIWIPQEVFDKHTWIPGNAVSVSVIINRLVVFVLALLFSAFINTLKRLFVRRVSIKRGDYQIDVEYGNILKKRNCKKVISFDECFTTHIGNLPQDIKETSICGQYLKANPDLDVPSLIKMVNLQASTQRSRFKDQVCYESGRLIPNGDELLLSFAKLDSDGAGRFFTRDEYLECLSVLWKEIDKYYEQKDVCIPILGAGLTRFESATGASISRQELLDIIICSYKLSSHKIKAPNKLRIICKKEKGFSIFKIDH